MVVAASMAVAELVVAATGAQALAFVALFGVKAAVAMEMVLEIKWR